MRKQRFTVWLILAIILISIYSVFSLKLLSGSNHEEKNITVILKSLNVRLNFWQAVNQGAEAAAKEMGLQLSVVGPLTEGGSDTQIRLLEEAIIRKPQAIVIAPIMDDRMRAALAKVRESGIKLVIINVTPSMKPAPAVVSSDHMEAGRLAGQTAIEATHGYPVIAIISDSANSIISEERLAGLDEVLDGFKESVLGVYYADNSEERAYEIAKQLLMSKTPFNTFITMNESASHGIARVLKEQNKEDDIDLIGFDSTSEDVQLLEAEVMKASIVQKPFNMGYLGVKTAIKLIEGEAVESITYIESNVVTKENMYTIENQKLLFPFITSK